MQVREIMTKKTDYISPSTSLKDAAAEMLKYNIGFIPVGEDGRLLGAITDRDLVVRAFAKNRSLEKTVAKDVMTPNILFCFEDDDLQKAAKSMSEKHVRRLVVLNRDKHIAGILSVGDIAVKAKDERLAGQILHSICEFERTEH